MRTRTARSSSAANSTAANSKPRRSSSALPARPSRDQTLTVALAGGTIIALYLCYRVALPFLPALAWSAALAVMAYPLHDWLQRWISRPTISAALAVVLVAAAVVGPAAFTVDRIAREASEYARVLQNDVASGRMRQFLQENPKLQPVLQWIDEQWPATLPSAPQQVIQQALAGEEAAAAKPNEDAPTKNDAQANGNTKPTDNADAKESQPTDAPEGTSNGASNGTSNVADAAGMVTRGIGSLFTGAAWFGMQLFTTFMALFFFFRDREAVLAELRSLMPLSDSEARLTLRRTHDVIHATVYGSLVVAVVQGFMGGLIFWWLELPAPLVWGTVMGLLAVVPVLGTFVIWGPTALFLAMQGEWTSAMILAGWGLFAIGMIDNFLYPFLVGRNMRFHTLAVFVAIIGGLSLFGASGVILGPLVLAVADALLEIWRRRTTPSQTAVPAT